MTVTLMATTPISGAGFDPGGGQTGSNTGGVWAGTPGADGGGTPGGGTSGPGSASRWGKTCSAWGDQDPDLYGGKPGPGYALVVCHTTFDGVALGGHVVAPFWSIETPTMDPAEVAQRILKTLTVQPINIKTVPEDKPGRVGLIGMPTWMWTNPTPKTIGPQDASDCIGGTCVDLTMKVTKVVWDMGDGNSVTCRGAGTPYADRYGKQNSPTCGYRYERTSLGKKKNQYNVTATSYWTAHWSGGGRSGDFYLEQTASSNLKIGELQVVVTQ